jgi:hypothetical protein
LPAFVPATVIPDEPPTFVVCPLEATVMPDSPPMFCDPSALVVIPEEPPTLEEPSALTRIGFSNVREIVVSRKRWV